MSSSWYIVNVSSGYENRISRAIQDQSKKHNLQQVIEQVVIPTEKVVQIKRGQKVNAEKKFLPGYILVKMEMNDTARHFIRNIPNVLGFLGTVSEAEVENIFNQMEKGTVSDSSSVSFEIGETVKVIDGPFESFTGVVSEVDREKRKIKVEVSIFGRGTPISLEYNQVERV